PADPAFARPLSHRDSVHGPIRCTRGWPRPAACVARGHPRRFVGPAVCGGGRNWLGPCTHRAGLAAVARASGFGPARAVRAGLRARLPAAWLCAICRAPSQWAARAREFWRLPIAKVSKAFTKTARSRCSRANHQQNKPLRRGRFDGRRFTAAGRRDTLQISGEIRGVSWKISMKNMALPAWHAACFDTAKGAFQKLDDLNGFSEGESHVDPEKHWNRIRNRAGAVCERRSLGHDLQH